MRRLLSILLTLILLSALLAAAALLLIPDRAEEAWAWAGLPPAAIAQARVWLGQSVAAPAAEIRLSGVLEARQIYAMNEIGGRVESVLVQPGDLVAAGQALATLEDAQIRREMAAAAAAVEAARAAYKAAVAPPGPEQAAVAAAAVAAAETNLANARRGLAQAEAELARPLALEAEIDRVAALLPAAAAEIERSQALIARLTIQLEQARGDSSREGKFQQDILARQIAAAEAGREAAAARRSGLQRTLALLRQMRNEPLALQAQARAAGQQVAVAAAALALAQADYAAAVAPPAPETAAVAAAAVQRAEAALAVAGWPLQHNAVLAPAAGRVQARLIEPGETVAAGAALFALADAAVLDVRVYVAQQDLPRLALGDVARVETPDRGQVEATVNFIAGEAQFRPTNLLDPEERGNIVFLVRLRLPNPDGALKAGMPVEILLPR